VSVLFGSFPPFLFLSFPSAALTLCLTTDDHTLPLLYSLRAEKCRDKGQRAALVPMMQSPCRRRVGLFPPQSRLPPFSCLLPYVYVCKCVCVPMYVCVLCSPAQRRPATVILK